MKIRKGEVNRLLVFMGGSDPDNITQIILNALARIPSVRGCLVDVIASSTNPHLAELSGQCVKMGWSLTVDAQDMADRMCMADAAIGAVGTTNLERFCLGLPTFALSIAHNQMQMLKDCLAQGLLCTQDYSLSLEENLERFLNDNSQRESISRRSSEMVDGRGISRIIKIMKKLTYKN